MSEATPQKPGEPPVDENAARLLVLREFLNRGLSLSEAIAATNDYFKKRVAEAQAERAA